MGGQIPTGWGGWDALVTTGAARSLPPTQSPGVLCEINEDDCATSPGSRAPKCLNNGTCVDRVGGYRCNCPPGYTGERCEGDINECLAKPCLPQRTLDCVQGANDFQCLCKPGYTGECAGGGLHPAQGHLSRGRWGACQWLHSVQGGSRGNPWGAGEAL